MKNETKPPEDPLRADGGSETVQQSSTATSLADCVENGQRVLAVEESNQGFLLELIRRAPLLEALEGESASQRRLAESVDMSRSTVHRGVKSLAGYDIIEAVNDEYELTSLGRMLTREIQTFATRAQTAQSLRQFLNAVDTTTTEIPIEHFLASTITRRTHRHPHATIHRIIRLIEASDHLRMFSSVISPVYVDIGYREMTNGMKIEAIFDRDVIELMAADYSAQAKETVNSGNFDLYVHDGLPFELFLLDDKIGVAAHNANGNAEMLIECRDPQAIEWAEGLYSKELSRATPVFESTF